MGSLGDGEFSKCRDGEFRRWVVEEMGSAADGKFTR